MTSPPEHWFHPNTYSVWSVPSHPFVLLWLPPTTHSLLRLALNMTLLILPDCSGPLKFRVHCDFAQCHSFNVSLTLPPLSLLSLEEDFHSPVQMNLPHTFRSSSIIIYCEGFPTRSHSRQETTMLLLQQYFVLLYILYWGLNTGGHRCSSSSCAVTSFLPLLFMSITIYCLRPQFIFFARIWAVLQVVGVLFSCCCFFFFFKTYCFSDLWSSQSEYHLLCT